MPRDWPKKWQKKDRKKKKKLCQKNGILELVGVPLSGVIQPQVQTTVSRAWDGLVPLGKRVNFRIPVTTDVSSSQRKGIGKKLAP